LVHGEWLPITLETIQHLDPWDFGQTLILGSLSLGILIGIPAGLITYGFALHYQSTHQRPEDPIGVAMQKTVETLKPFGPFAFRYAAGKFKHDPIYRQLANRCPLREPILDIGCGRGQTQLLLAHLNSSISIVGLDWDEDKIALATQAAKPFENIRFQKADSRSASLPKSGTILMLDILHYNSIEEQNLLLRQVADALEPGGLVLIREMDTAQGWRSILTRWQETLGIWIGINKGATLCFRPAQEICDVLEQAGLKTTLIPSWADTPLSNVLIEGRKAPKTSPS
jgi:SAM-dependent methyltransferase